MRRKPPPGRSLAERFPKIASEWHPTRNGDLAASDVFAGSDTRIWWQCVECGFEWATKLEKRVKLGQGCRRCAVARRAKTQSTPKPGESLAEAAPDLALDWHFKRNPGRTPSDVRITSGTVVWWRCSTCGHEWRASVYKRSTGNGCHKCAVIRRARRRSTPKRGDSFADRHPCEATEWHSTKNAELEPTDVRPASNKKVWWQCSAGHEWQVSPANRQRGERCPECSKQLIPIKRSTPKPGRSLADLFPDVASEWHPTLNDPVAASDINPGSRKPRWWQCSHCGHVWMTNPDKRTRRGDGCRECSPIGVSARQIRLECELHAAGLPVVTGHPPIPVPGRRAVRADIVMPAIHFVVEYDGVRFHRGLQQRDQRQTVALENAGWTVVRVRETPLTSLGGNELFVSPVEPIKSVTLKVLDLMSALGHPAAHLAAYSVDPEPWAETAARKAIHRHRTVSFASENPDLAAEFDPAKNDDVRADQIHPKSHTKFVWTCRECGHNWSTTPALRATGHGCPKCGYRRVGEKRSRPPDGGSFADLFPAAAREWHPTRNAPYKPNQVRPARGLPRVRLTRGV